MTLKPSPEARARVREYTWDGKLSSKSTWNVLVIIPSLFLLFLSLEIRSYIRIKFQILIGSCGMIESQSWQGGTPKKCNFGPYGFVKMPIKFFSDCLLAYGVGDYFSSFFGYIMVVLFGALTNIIACSLTTISHFLKDLANKKQSSIWGHPCH